VKAAPQSWRCIGQEVSEQLDFEPAYFLLLRVIRRKYVHRADLDQSPVIAPLPDCLQERGVAAPGLLAHVLVGNTATICHCIGRPCPTPSWPMRSAPPAPATGAARSASSPPELNSRIFHHQDAPDKFQRALFIF
jgi:hypothetical protein